MYNINCSITYMYGASQVVLVVKNSPAKEGEAWDVGSIPGSGRSPERGHGNPLQYSCLENAMNRGAWQATVHSISNSQTQLKQFGTHAHICMYKLLWISLEKVWSDTVVRKVNSFLTNTYTNNIVLIRRRIAFFTIWEYGQKNLYSTSCFDIWLIIVPL